MSTGRVRASGKNTPIPNASTAVAPKATSEPEASPGVRTMPRLPITASTAAPAICDLRVPIRSANRGTARLASRPMPLKKAISPAAWATVQPRST